MKPFALLTAATVTATGPAALVSLLGRISVDSVWVERLGWTLIHTVWQFALVALAAAALQWSLRCRSARVRYAAGVLMLGAMAVAPVVTFGVVDVSRPGGVKPKPPGVKRTPDAMASHDQARFVPSPMAESDAREAPMPRATPPRRRAAETLAANRADDLSHERSSVSWVAVFRNGLAPRLPLFVSLWLAGMALFSLRPVWGLWMQWRLRRVGLSPVPPPVALCLDDLARRLGVSRTVGIAQSVCVGVPMAIGYLRPLILLPGCVLTGLTADQLQALLAHELAHVRRHDWLVNAFQVLVETVFFYHPAVWWLSRQIRRERENCCDDLAVSLVGDRGTVGRMLLAIEELPERTPGLVLAATGGNLLSRVRRVLATGRQPEPPGREWLPAAVLLLMAGLGGAAWAMSADTGEKKNPPSGSVPPAAPASTATGKVSGSDGKPLAGTQVAAMVNGQPIYCSEVFERAYPEPLAAGGLSLLAAAKNPGRVTDREVRQLQVMAIRKYLKDYVRTRVLCQALESNLEKEQKDKIEQAIGKMFDEYVQKLKKDLKVLTDAEVDGKLKESGTTLASLKVEFRYRLLADEYVRQKLKKRHPLGRQEVGAYDEKQRQEQAIREVLMEVYSHSIVTSPFITLAELVPPGGAAQTPVPTKNGSDRRKTSLAAAASKPGVGEPTITGKVHDSDGKPVAGATVMIWGAGVKHGYSTYCPGCYADCGKSAVTDAGGAFAIAHVDPELRFRLLIVREGYGPIFAEKVDPFGGPTAVTLSRRPLPDNASQVVHGHVVGPHGEPLAGAIVEAEAVGYWDEQGHSVHKWGTVKGLDPLAVTNAQGNFEIAYVKPARAITLMVRARGMAPQRFTELETGTERHTLALNSGGSIRGRLVSHGQPVGRAEMGLVARDRNVDNFYSEVRIGTEPDGSFLFANVPVPGKWYVYAKMDSLRGRGATNALECVTEREDETLNLGDVKLQPGHRLSGRVALSDGKPIPDGMRILISARRAWDNQTRDLPADGRFEFVGLPTDDFSINPAVKGYHPSSKHPLNFSLDGSIDRDIDNFVILLDPGQDRFNPIGQNLRGKPLRGAP